MYIRKATRTYKNKTYTNYLLVESHLTPKGPRQKVVCSLGDLSPRPKQQWLELTRKLESALTGQQDLFAAPLRRRRTPSPGDQAAERAAARAHEPAAPAGRQRRSRGRKDRRLPRSRAGRTSPRGRFRACGLSVLAAPGSGRDPHAGGAERARTPAHLRRHAEPPDSSRQRTGHAGLDPLHGPPGHPRRGVRRAGRGRAVPQPGPVARVPSRDRSGAGRAREELVQPGSDGVSLRSDFHLL